MSSLDARPQTDLTTIVVSALGFAFGLAWLAGILLVFRQTEVVDGQVVYVFGDYWGYDIEAYVRAAGRLVEGGSLYLPEQIETPYLPGGKDYYHYAPPLGVAFVPLSDMAESDISAVWFLLKSAALLLACLLMPVRLPVQALTFVAVAVSFWAMKDLVLGNVGVLLVLPMVATWRWLDRPLGSIALALTVSIRPSTGVLLVWQLSRQQWRAAAWTIGAGLVLIALSAAVVGIDGYRDYLDVLGNMVTPSAGTENRDLGATAVSLGLDKRWAELVRFGSIALGTVLVVLGLRRDRELSFMITLTASALMVPLMWEFYLIMLALPLALLADRWRPLVLLMLVLSWLPPAFAPLILLATLALLFLLPARPQPPGLGSDVRSQVPA